MNNEIGLFLDYLGNVRNYSEHTLKNYSADLKSLKFLEVKRASKVGLT